MIERQWHGITTVDNAERYIAHLEKDTFPKLKNLEGYLGAKVLRKTIANGNISFLIVTCWESIQKNRSFCGY
jgi:heme-degrading monooxygenase HmoA